MELMDLLDNPVITGGRVEEWLRQSGKIDVETRRVQGREGFTDFVKARVKSPNPTGPTLGIIGRLGGVGARPKKLGLVSDADGCIVALAAAAKLAQMSERGDALSGHVIVTTHICPNAPTIPHEPTPFMGCPVDIEVMNRMEVDQEMKAILSIDTTKGNWILNQRGFAITPTCKQGYILRVSDPLLEIMRCVTGQPPVVLAITTQDITPYGNGVYHLNSIMQPATTTSAPVVGVALTACLPVPGCATGANQIFELEMAARFCVEVAKAFTAGICSFFDRAEYDRLLELYGTLAHLQGVKTA
jgi:hypothetical protein